MADYNFPLQDILDFSGRSLPEIWLLIIFVLYVTSCTPVVGDNMTKMTRN